MINSTPSPDRTPATPMQVPAQPKRPASVSAKDTFTPQQLLALRATIDAQTAVREDMIIQGMALAADDSYPSQAILHSIAKQILKAQDAPAE